MAFIEMLACLDKQNFTSLVCVYFNKEQIDILTKSTRLLGMKQCLGFTLQILFFVFSIDFTAT